MKRRRRRNPEGDNLGLIVAGVVLTGAAFAGLLWWGNSRATALPASPVDPRAPERIGFFPDLKLGDFVQIDAIAANVPGAGPSMPTLVCVVDLILTDRTLVSVHDLSGVFFRGTVPRSSILHVLPPRVPGFET